MVPIEEIIAVSPEGVLCCRPDGKIVHANRKAARILGYRSCDELFSILGTLTGNLLVDANDEAVLRNHLERRGALRNAQVVIKKANGGCRWIKLNARIMLAEDNASMLLFHFTDITRQKLEEQRLMHQATTDSLTGICNRAQFDLLLKDHIAEAVRHGDTLGLLLFDVDGFKEINDTYGHSVGDMTLRAITDRVHKSIRNSDVFARIGGDEFCILAKRIESAKDMQIMAEKVNREFDSPLRLDGLDLKVSISIGLATCPHQGSCADDLIDCADRDMYAQKRSK